MFFLNYLISKPFFLFFLKNISIEQLILIYSQNYNVPLPQHGGSRLA